MFHSSYVAGKMGIWKEQGRKRLSGLLAKMGWVHDICNAHPTDSCHRFSIPQTQQLYAHMDMDLKRQLRDKLDAIAPEYGMIELTYPSFVRCYGYHMQPLSAADAIDALNALLDVATGVQIEVERDGARNGGEWFGGGRVWRAAGRWGLPEAKETANDSNQEELVADARVEERESSLVRNFWNAFDALEE